MTVDHQWVGLAISLGAYLVGGGVFVGVVRVTIKSLTDSIDKLEKRVDQFDGFSRTNIGAGANIEARVAALEREMRELRDLRDLVIENGTLQKAHHEAAEKSMKALEERVASAVAMIANAARREGKIA